VLPFIPDNLFSFTIVTIQLTSEGGATTFDLSLKLKDNQTKNIIKTVKKSIMKKLLFTTLIAISLVTSSFAKDVNKVSNKTISNFRAEFVEADNVVWTSRPGYAKADFVLNNIKMEAFYDHSGNMIGSSHAISLNDLPTTAKRAFAKKYSNYTVKEAILFDSMDEIAYYISAENDTQEVILKVCNGIISTFRKTNKN
jgi:hypothetical protein